MAFTHGLIVDGELRQLFESDPGLPESWHVIDLTDYPDAAEGWLLQDDGKLVPPPPPPPPPILDITAAQAVIQCSRMKGSAKGKTLWDDVTATAEVAGGEAALWLAKAPAWRRDVPYLATLFPNASASDLDGLFRDAKQINA